MANDSVSISGPVHVVSDSPQRVALELAQYIDACEPVETLRDKIYWLSLFAQCYYVATGGTAKDAVARR